MSNVHNGQDFVQLRAFVQVADLLNFGRAASHMGITPSALSQTIRALEERVGIRLLNRTTRSVSLTDAGRDLLEQIRPALDAIDAATASVSEAAGKASGTIRVIATCQAAFAHVLPKLESFYRHAPAAVVDLTVNDASLDFVASGFDAAIRPGEVIDKDLIAVRIGSDHRQVAFASPAYIEANGTPASPDELIEHRCIRWRWDGQDMPYDWEFHRDGRWFQVRVDGPLIVNNRMVMIEAAAEGLGIGFATEEEISSLVAHGRVLPLLEDWTETFPGVFLCYARHRRMAPALRLFIDHMREAPSFPSP